MPFSAQNAQCIPIWLFLAHYLEGRASPDAGSQPSTCRSLLCSSMNSWSPNISPRGAGSPRFWHTFGRQEQIDIPESRLSCSQHSSGRGACGPTGIRVPTYPRSPSHSPHITPLNALLPNSLHHHGLHYQPPPISSFFSLPCSTPLNYYTPLLPPLPSLPFQTAITCKLCSMLNTFQIVNCTLIIHFFKEEKKPFQRGKL